MRYCIFFPILIHHLTVEVVGAFTIPFTTKIDLRHQSSSLFQLFSSNHQQDQDRSDGISSITNVSSLNRRDAIQTSGKLLAGLLLSSSAIDLAVDVETKLVNAVDELQSPKTILVTGTFPLTSLI